MVQVCLNGVRGSADGAMVPLTPEAMAESAAQAVAAGATDIHVHPKTPCGHDSLSPRVIGPVLEAIRARVSVPVGVTTGAWAEPDPAARLMGVPPRERVRAWGSVRSWATLAELPDRASVNWHEEGAEEIAAALLDLGVG